jgi:lysophospholipase L1-like esterase
MNLRRLQALKKPIFATVAIVLFFSMLEGATRAYSFVIRGNALSLRYGEPFVRRWLNGTLRLQDAYPLAAVQEQEDTTDWIFEHRQTDDPDVWLAEHDPVDVPGAGVVYHLNRFGLRGPDFPEQKPTGLVRIATLGGSFVLGWDLDEDHTWPNLLERHLNSDARHYDVINAGVNGANINKAVALLVRLTHDVQLDAVVVASAYNDHTTLRVSRRYPFAARLDFALYNLSWSYVMAREKLSRLSREPLEYSLYRQRVHVDAADVEAWRRTYRRRLAEIATICREHQIRLILMAEPEMFFDRTVDQWRLPDDSILSALDARIRDGNDLWRMELEYYMQGTLDREMRRFAIESGSTFFDAAGIFPADKRPLFIDQIHPNPAGSDLIAAKLAEMIREQPDGALTIAEGSRVERLASPTAVTSSGQPSPYVTAMREAGGLVSRLRDDVQAHDFTAARSEAVALGAWFDRLPSFGETRTAADMSLFMRSGSAAAVALARAAATRSDDGVAVARRALVGACRSCHDVHRAHVPAR